MIKVMRTLHYGEHIRKLRRKKHISQFVMSYHLYISQATYSRIESQEAMCDWETNRRIAKVFDVSPFELIPGVKELTKDEIQHVWGRKTKHRPSKRGRRFRILLFLLCITGIVILLISPVYIFASGVCSGLKVSPHISLVIQYSAVIFFLLTIYFWIRLRWHQSKIGRSSNTKLNINRHN